LGACTVANPNYHKRDAAADAQNDVSYHYVVNKLWVPTSTAQSNQYGLDLNGDGKVDNSFGGAITSLAAAGLDVQASLDKAVLGGKLIMLASLDTPDLSTAAGARMRFFVGDQSLPAACSGPLDTVTCTNAKPSVCVGCGHQLADGSFSIALTSPQETPVAGTIMGGAFTGGPGNAAFILSIMGKGAPIRLDLIGARISATGISASTIGGSSQTDGIVIAGAVKQEDVIQKVLPAVQTQIAAVIKKNCKSLNSPPACGCAANSVGAKILGSIVNSTKDCSVTVDEVNAMATLLLPQDVVIDGIPAVSIGVRATAVKAKFAVPVQ